MLFLHSSAHLRQKHLFSRVGYLTDKATAFPVTKNSLLLLPGFKVLPLAEKFCISMWLHTRSDENGSLDENNSLLLLLFPLNYAVCAGGFYKACSSSSSGFPVVHQYVLQMTSVMFDLFWCLSLGKNSSHL